MTLLYRQPSGITKGVDFLFANHWTPAQALAVFELLDDLRDSIGRYYAVAIDKQLREERGIIDSEDSETEDEWNDELLF